MIVRTDYELARIWADQADFNGMLRTPPEDFRSRSVLTSEMVLHMHSELDELLRTTDWKSHRRVPVQENRARTVEELVDLWKYLMTLAQVWGVTPEEFCEAYWRKSAVVRQRHSEEFMKTLDKPCVIVDIDNVIGDYTMGILDWIAATYPQYAVRCAELKQGDHWIDGKALQVDDQRWQEIKHRFRVTGGKRTLPIIRGVKDLLNNCRTVHGWQIILLTSRPIDQYPNIYSDTLAWLQANDVPFDFIWWALDKRERVLAAGVRPLVKMFIDDQWHYVKHFAQMGIPSVWYRPRGITEWDQRAVQEFNDANGPGHHTELIELPAIQIVDQFYKINF